MTLRLWDRTDSRNGITSSAFTILHCGRSSDFILGALTGLQAQALLYDIDLLSILEKLSIEGMAVSVWLEREFGFRDLVGLLE